ncbi:MAG: hypothetical protein J0L82_12650 [Deltaproteobacteria bacterium]|jgi:hypothetical protein|nr:hypothetical protein [Deltaproteobacteria bacterium]
MNTRIFKRSILLAATLFATITSTVTWAQPTDTEVTDFALHWFKSFDQNAPVQDFLNKIEANDLEMTFPEKTLRSHQEFQEWYSGVQRDVRQAEHLIQSVVINKKSKDEIWATVRVVWNAEKFNGEKVEFHARQKWTLTFRDATLRIKNYFVEEDLPQRNEPQVLFSVKSALDSELVCTCHGGPGGYPYRCPPVKKTCYGGPGYYPYDCMVCPE